MHYIIILIFSFSLGAEDFLALEVKANDCEFYEKLEKKRGCYEIGFNYLLDYGYRYCKLFNEARKSWYEPLYSWVATTSLCLQHDLRSFDLLYENNLGPGEKKLYCSALEKRAFASHNRCYKMHGFCALSLRDKVTVIHKLINKDIFYKALPSLKQAIKTTVDCSKKYIPYDKCTLL